MVTVLNRPPLWTAQTPLLLSPPRNLRVPQGRPIPQSHSPMHIYPRVRPTRSTNLRHSCGKTSFLMPRTIKLLKLPRIGHRHLLTPRLLVNRNYRYPFQIHIPRPHALLVSIPPLVHILSTPFLRPPRRISLKSMANGVASSALAQAVRCAS